MDVTNSRHEDVKHIKCPGCGSALAVSFIAEDTTVLGTAQRHGTGLPALKHNGREYPLKVGDNTIGRKAVTSSATVQIATDDRTMSRQHAVIGVVRLGNGRYKSTIRVDKGKNPTVVEGMAIGDDECIVLNDGDKIRMGSVTVTFTVNTGAEEETLKSV